MKTFHNYALDKFNIEMPRDEVNYDELEDWESDYWDDGCPIEDI